MQKPIYFSLLLTVVCLLYGFNIHDPKANIGLSLSGQVLDNEGNGIPNINIQLEGGELSSQTKTDSDGNYKFNNLIEGNYYIIKPLASTISCKTSLLDLVLVNHYLYDLNLFQKSNDFVAADVDQSNEINYLDVVKIRESLLRSEGETKSTTVQKTGFDIKSNDELKGLSNEYVVKNLNSSKNDLNYILIKRGEVNANRQKKTNESLNLYIENKYVKKGEVIKVPLYTKDYLGIVASSFEMDIDNQKLQLLNIESENLEESKFFSNQSLIDNLLKLNMIEYTVKSKSIFDNLPLYTFEFEVINNGYLEDALIVNNTSGNAVDHNYREYNVVTTFEEVNEETYSNEGPEYTMLHQNYPNPFNRETIVNYDIKNDQEVELQIVDSQGKIVWKEHKFYTKGNYEKTLTNSHFLSGGGVYKFYLKTKENLYVKSLFCLK
jgi:hypothetical protein